MKKGEERIMSVFIPVRKILSILFSLFIICLISIILIHIFQWSRQGKNFSILGYQLLIQQTYSIGDVVTVGDVMVMRSQDGYQADDIVSYLDLEGNVVADQISYVDTTQNDFGKYFVVFIFFDGIFYIILYCFIVRWRMFCFKMSKANF